MNVGTSKALGDGLAAQAMARPELAISLSN